MMSDPCSRTIVALAMAIVAPAALVARVVMDPLEGKWLLADDAVVQVMPPRGNGNMDVTVVDSPDLRLAPGTVVGYARATGPEGAYTITITPPHADDNRPETPETLDVRLCPGDVDALEITHRQRLRVEAWLLWRHLFTATVRPVKQSGVMYARRVSDRPSPLVL